MSVAELPSSIDSVGDVLRAERMDARRYMVADSSEEVLIFEVKLAAREHDITDVLRSQLVKSR